MNGPCACPLFTDGEKPLVPEGDRESLDYSAARPQMVCSVAIYRTSFTRKCQTHFAGAETIEAFFNRPQRQQEMARHETQSRINIGFLLAFALLPLLQCFPSCTPPMCDGLPPLG